MSKQWIFVGLIVAGVAAGATIMTKVGSEVAPVQVGATAPEFHAVDLATRRLGRPCTSGTAAR